MVRIAEQGRGAALFSPLRDQFVILTRRGDLERGINVDTLLLFRTSSVESYLKDPSGSSRPTSELVITKDIEQNGAGISQVQWLNDGEIDFIAQGDNEKTQVFAVDVSTKHLSQLTHSPTGVASYATEGHVVVYHAFAPQSPGLVTALNDRNIYELIAPDEDWIAPTELFKLQRETGEVQKLTTTVERLQENFRRIWLSPDGNYGVTFAPATDVPLEWADYQIPYPELLGYDPSRGQSDALSRDLQLRVRYQLIDLRKNTIRPLLDAPISVLSNGKTSPTVFWPFLTTVVVSNTYLPLSAVSPEERAWRQSSPGVAEVDLRAGTVKAIAWQALSGHGMSTGRQARSARFETVEWNDRAGVLRLGTASGRGSTRYSYLRWRGGQWRAVRMGVNDYRNGPSIYIGMGLNERPRLFAKDERCRCAKEIFDPDPSASQFSFGKVEVRRWRDSNNLEWEAGLVFPPGFVEGKRYPLVVQTHGFDATEFLIDGPYGGTTAMAAQALASAGMLVLQVKDQPQAITSDEREGALVAEGFRSGIRELVLKGLADGSKVGLIAFSRTGYHAVQLLAEDPQLLTAVDISDSIQPGYLQDLLLVNSQLQAEMRRLNGGSPAETGYAEWFSKDPLYKLRTLSTAVRLEAIGPASALAMWETYAVLRTANRRVDFVYFPNGSHVLTEPDERLGSQGGNVDWFRFWLQDYRDPDPRKESQYRRWERLRELEVRPH